MATKTFEVKNNSTNGVRSISLLFVPVFACETTIENILKTDAKHNNYIFRYNVSIKSDTFNTNIYKLNIEYNAELDRSLVSIDRVYNTIYCKCGSYSDIKDLVNEAMNIICKNSLYPYHIYDAFDYDDKICKIIRNKIANL